MFYGCTVLTGVTIPDGVNSIGYSTFCGCTGLTSIAIPERVTAIGDEAFKNCTGITDVVVSDSVTEIGYRAFEGCSSLTSITLPFVGATKDGSKNTHFGYIFGAFHYGGNPTCVPSGLQTLIITGGTSIADCAFYYCTGLTSIEMPNSMTSIGSRAFQSCSSITSIQFQGTASQWDAATKGNYWNEKTGAYTVYCTDSTVSK